MRIDGELQSIRTGATASEISRAIVRLNARLYGRGPVKAKTIISDDCVVCVLESVFTTAERTLISLGRDDEVRRSRDAFLEASESELCEIVARATGRQVRGCVAGVHTELDAAAKVFFLGAATDDGSSRDGDGRAAGALSS